LLLVLSSEGVVGGFGRGLFFEAGVGGWEVFAFGKSG